MDRSSATINYFSSQNNLGYAYSKGDEIKIMIPTSERWLLKGSEKGRYPAG